MAPSDLHDLTPSHPSSMPQPSSSASVKTSQRRHHCHQDFLVRPGDTSSTTESQDIVVTKRNKEGELGADEFEDDYGDPAFRLRVESKIAGSRAIRQFPVDIQSYIVSALEHRGDGLFSGSTSPTRRSKKGTSVTSKLCSTLSRRP
jgi:hypothetical protein